MERGKALIASAQEETARKMIRELAGLHLTAQAAFSAPEARNALKTGDFSILMIVLPLPGDGAQLALDAARHTDCAVVLIGREEMREETGVQKARESGALFLVRPLRRETLSFVLECALAIHRRVAFLQEKNALLKRQMREIGAVERAKYLLMQTLGLTEAQAHRLIEKQAMDERQTRAEVAMRILKTYENV